MESKTTSQICLRHSNLTYIYMFSKKPLNMTLHEPMGQNTVCYLTHPLVLPLANNMFTRVTKIGAPGKLSILEQSIEVLCL